MVKLLALLFSAVAFASGGGILLPSPAGQSGNCLESNGSTYVFGSCGGGGGGGTVTSVSLTAPSYLTVSGSPITSSGTIGLSGTSETANFFLAAPNGSSGALAPRAIVSADIPTLNQNTSGTAANVSGTVTVGHGGTGLTAGTSGGIPYFSSSSAITSSAALTNHALLLGGGAGASPTALGSLGTSTTLLHGNSSGAPNYSGVNLTNDVVSGSYLPLANGGSGFTNIESILNLSGGGIPSSPYNDFPISAYSNFIVVQQTPYAYDISGMVPNAVSSSYGQEVAFYNSGVNTLWFGGSGSAAGHGFCPVGGGTYFYLPYGNSVTWKYEQSNACWYNTTPGQLDAGNAPGTVSSSDYSYWNGKQNAISFPGSGAILYNSAQGDTTKLFLDTTDNYVNFNNSSSEVAAGLYIGSPNPQTFANVTSGSNNQVNISDGYSPPTYQSFDFDETGSGYGPANGTTYQYGLASCIEVEGVCYGTSGADTGGQGDPNDGSYFYTQVYYADSGASQTIVTCEAGCSGGPELVGNGGGQPFTDPGGLTTNAPSLVSASASGIQATGSSNLTETLTIYAYNGAIYSSTGFTINGNDDGSNDFAVGDFSWGSVAGAVSYYVIASGPAGNGSFTTTSTHFVLTATSSFSGSTSPPTPTSIPAPAIQLGGGSVVGPSSSWSVSSAGFGSFDGLNDSSLTPSTAVVTDSSNNLSSSGTTVTELGYLSGVTSGIQSQINSRATLASPTFTGTVTAPTFKSSSLTASTALVSDSSKNIVSSTTTSAELGYVHGVTSAIQTQISALAPIASPTFTGLVSLPHLAGTGSPGIGAGSGAGSSPTLLLSGSDLAGLVTVTTGTLPSGSNAVIATVSFAASYSTAPHCLISPANALTAALSGVSMAFATSVTGSFSINSGTTALAASSTYKWNYICSQ